MQPLPNKTQEGFSISPESGIKLSVMSDQFGVSGAQELRRLRGNLEMAKLTLKANPENKDNQMDERIAELEVELFENEHDNAGAFKFNRYGREMRDLFEAEGEERLSLDAEGRIEAGEAMLDRRMIMVNMSELDRFNKEGGHEAGDEVLKNTAHGIETAVRDVLGEGADYRMFRADSCEFMVDFKNVSPADIKRVQARLAQLKPHAPGVKEAAPLTICEVGLMDAIEAVNKVQEREGILQFESEDEANRALIDMVRNTGFFKLEVDKTATRAERIRSKILNGAEGEAEAFFENYGREFHGTKLDSVKAFRELIDKGDKEWESVIKEVGFSNARRRFEIEEKVESTTEAVITAAVSEKLKGAPVFRDQAGDGQDGDLPLAKIPDSSIGQRALEELQAKYEGVPDESAKEKKLAMLEFKKEDSARDRGTGLYTRGSYYRQLEKEGGSVIFIDMGFLKYFDKKGGREVGNGALKVAASILEQAVARSGIKGEAYRLAGDEFGVRFDGPASEAEKFTKAMNEIRDEAGRIPATDRSDYTYAPEKLRFNYGVCDQELMDKVYADLLAAGCVPDSVLNDPSRLKNFQAELKTAIADKGIEEQKSKERFELLVERLRDEAYAKDTVRKDQVEAVIVYSKKALFTEIGGEDELRRIANDNSLQGESLKGEIKRVVEIKLEEAHLLKTAERRMRVQLIEMHVQISQLERELEATSGENKELIARLERVKREKDELMGVRQAIDQAS
jgi:GGDEF domain-containing protein